MTRCLCICCKFCKYAQVPQAGGEGWVHSSLEVDGNSRQIKYANSNDDEIFYRFRVIVNHIWDHCQGHRSKLHTLTHQTLCPITIDLCQKSLLFCVKSFSGSFFLCQKFLGPSDFWHKNRYFWHGVFVTATNIVTWEWCRISLRFRWWFQLPASVYYFECV